MSHSKWQRRDTNPGSLTAEPTRLRAHWAPGVFSRCFTRIAISIASHQIYEVVLLSPKWRSEKTKAWTENCLCLPHLLLKCYLWSEFEFKSSFVLNTPLGRVEVSGVGETPLVWGTEVWILSLLVLASWLWEHFRALLSLDFLMSAVMEVMPTPRAAVSPKRNKALRAEACSRCSINICFVVP